MIPTINDPLAINLKRQTRALLSKLPSQSPYAAPLTNVSSRPLLLAELSNLLSKPALTLTIATEFRPVLFDLCARWLNDNECTEERLIALCLLLEPHEELYPILSAFLRKPVLQNGPFALVITDAASAEPSRVHRLLLAYYRLLQANRQLPSDLFWSLAPLSALIWTPHPDTGVRLLAIRCYALQSGMGEAEREILEKQVLGEICGVDCLVEYGEDIDGKKKEIDGWLLPTLEIKRITDARNTVALDSPDYYAVEEGDLSQPIHPSELSHLVANIHGILLFRSPGPSGSISPLITTATVIASLRALAIHLSLRLPILLTSAPSAGKSLHLSHLATMLHPGSENHIITIHLADTSLDPRSLLGSYISSPTYPGQFEWKEGVLVRAMREGKWVVFEDIDRGSSEVLGVIKPLIESLGLGKWIGGRAAIEVPSRGRVEADETFAIFATRSLAPSNTGKFPDPVFFGAHKFHEVVVPSPTPAELRTIIDSRFIRLAGHSAQALIRLWEAIKALGSAASTRDVGLRELEKFCARVDNLLPTSHQGMDLTCETESVVSLSSIFPNPTLREDMFLEARDVFFGAGGLTASARSHAEVVANTIAEHLGLEPDRRDWVLQGRIPEFNLEKDVNGNTTAVRLGRTRLPACSARVEISSPATRPFAMHKPAVRLLSRIGTAVSLSEPVLLTGETGTGKTSVVTHLASLLRRPLVSLNLSHQTESSDLLGGFKPVDARIPGSVLQERFLELFGITFSRRKNAKFEESVRKAVSEGKWKRAVGLWKESTRLAKDRIRAKQTEEPSHDPDADLASETPRKRRKVDQVSLSASGDSWDAFEKEVLEFDVQHVQAKGRFAFSFVEGPLVKALRSGDWILLDEINLASSETLECISGLLRGSTASITLTEQGSLEPVPRHSDFRLFACMNPATDVGKKDLPPNIRSRFTEIEVPPPDADKDTLISIITQYIGPNALSDKAAIMNVAEFYIAVKKLAEGRQIADGSNHKPHYSMRTLARALTFAADMASTYSLRRSLWEGCLMAFTMVLDAPSAIVVTALAEKHLLAGVRNPRSLLSKEPSVPHNRTAQEFVKFGPFYLEKGPLSEDPVDDYIMTPSVESKLVDLARIIVTRRFPVLIEGPTSSGKTSSIEYLARRTGHRFVRINNHEHTDIQEYLGSYVSDSMTGKLVFKDGLLVRALRTGDWIVLDELNLAPTDVLEALNRLLDDNRELVIPETHEVVRPHPHFMLFATQNPPGLYAGRKVLSRAFRNRFLEVHFEDVPQDELETILCQRCRIAPSYGQRIVTVFRELQKRRQSGRVFESKHGFATLRDLFRWAGRDAIGYQQLAENGYMLLAERARRADDKNVVKEVIETVMKVRIDERSIYNLKNSSNDPSIFLGCPIPSSSPLIWTTGMQRLFVLVSRALRFNEPVLLVGETGSGKTSVCQVYADAVKAHLHSLNCHQNTETADLIGGLRPVRNRSVLEVEVTRELATTLENAGIANLPSAPEAMLSAVDSMLKSPETRTASTRSLLEKARSKLIRLASIFEWHDGPLVDAMRNGEIFLLDEISLADDSVLERLNSVLEPERTIVLAERGGDDLELPFIQAASGFKLVATMNPGGDYGKKELSPALRNRFTEIWVPPVDDRHDLELIVNNLWGYEPLRPYTGGLLDFADWLCEKVGDRSLLSLRDILAWVTFSNAVYRCPDQEEMPPNEIFHHAAYMTFLDGLHSMPQLAAYSGESLRRLKMEAISKLQDIAPLQDNDGSLTYVPVHDPSRFIQLGSFAIPKGPKEPALNVFNLQAPTTRENAMRVVRACQVAKPVLLEGSPGVGKTSLVTTLASLSGHHLCRINLSDQTDLIDLFGSDLPVEGGGPGEFAWRDAEFLKAMQEGHWVLLDEMNLAPQAVLEGLNAVLDHRGTVYIPELHRSFTRHPAFRIFAAQNPLHQGGGRKGLPKSFLNRFTKVYVEELSPDDLLLVCRHLFPHHNSDIIRAMITYNTRLSQEVATKRTFGREGSPWEFNLRDVIRWVSLLDTHPPCHPADQLRSIYLHRLRNIADRNHARMLFDDIFSMSTDRLCRAPYPMISPSLFQVGLCRIPRKNLAALTRPARVLQIHLSALEAVGNCITQSWLAVVTGPHGSGKNNLIRVLANFTGNRLHEVSVNSATDTMDILGSFEQVDNHGRVLAVIRDVLSCVECSLRVPGIRFHPTEDYIQLRRALQTPLVSVGLALGRAERLLDEVTKSVQDLGSECQRLHSRIQDLRTFHDATGRFEWVDGPLVDAMKKGHWLLLDGANLCSPSVLDRLNSLCEPDGMLILGERGFVGGNVQVVKAHPNFRLFMCLDPRYGELSRAMRNRGIEVALLDDFTLEDQTRLQDHFRLPLAMPLDGNSDTRATVFDVARRGLLSPYPTNVSLEFPWPSGHIIDQDVASSTLVARAPFLETRSALSEAEVETLMHFLPRMIAPAYVVHVQRFLFSGNAAMELQTHRLQAILRALINHRHLLTSSSPVGDGDHTGDLHSNSGSIQISDSHFTSLVDLDCNVEDGRPFPRLASLQALNLLVALIIDHEEAEASNHGHSDRTFAVSARSNADGNQRAVIEVDLLLHAVPATGKVALEALQSEDEAGKSDVELALKLLGYTRFLRRVVENPTFDYSAIQAVSRWIATDLQQFPPSFLHLVPIVKALEKASSLSTGLGLTEIWSALLSHRYLEPSLADLYPMENMASNLKHAKNVYGLRSQVLELLALRTLPTEPSSAEETMVSSLAQRVEMELSGTCSDGTIVRACENEPSLITTELSILAALGGVEGSYVSTTTIQLLQDLIRLVCEDSRGSLLRFVTYQHTLWAIRADKARLPIIAQAQTQWLQAIWTIPSSENVSRGPSALLYPTDLLATIRHCDWSRQSLSSLDKFDGIVRRQLGLTSMRCISNVPRLEQLSAVFLQSLLLVSSCFEDTFDNDDILAMKSLGGASQLGSSNSIMQALFLMEKTSNIHFGQAVRLGLRPALQRLNIQQSRRGRVVELGKCWIALGRLIVDLYVPDKPIDPAAIQNCALNFWREEQLKVCSQIDIHAKFEQRVTGNATNGILVYLNARLDEIRHRLATTPSLPLHDRHDVLRLHMFWSEVSQFLAHILSPSKFELLVSSIEAGDPSASMREQVLQESLFGFCQRLDTAYPEYRDISTPLHLAVLQTRLGLRLLSDAMTFDAQTNSRSITHTASAIVAFPAVRSASLVCTGTAASSPSGLPPCQDLLLKLAANAFHVFIGVDLNACLDSVETICEQILRLWLIDRARETEAEQSSQSLYRRKPLDHDDIGEAEMEEQEFLALFPNFEDALEQGDNTEPKDRYGHVLIDSFQVRQVVDLHHAILRHPRENEASSSNPAAIFNDMRKEAVSTLVQTHAESLPDTLDNESLPFRFALLHARFSELQTPPNSSDKPYNFYLHANVLESRRATVVVEALKMRLEVLVREWPDQMVLQHLKSRCDLVLGLNLHSPIAKTLNALEQLLMQSEDWEIYANRENTLKQHRQALTDLIVDWRRLELSCWQALLESTAQSFSEGTFDSWFYLYDAVVRGSMDATTKDDAPVALGIYLQKLITLLDEFIHSSPLGQYEARIQLLRTFEAYVGSLAYNRTGHQKYALCRVERILHSTTTYYGLFSGKISMHLKEQRTLLEKEIRGFIKLASWKDINVHALKQSAQRTHRQLYKIIRKFRDVLRQPTAGRLQPELAGDGECRYLVLDSSSEVSATANRPIFPDDLSEEPSPAHLLDLNRTFTKFDILITSRIRTFVYSRSAHVVDNLSVDIITTAKNLASISIARDALPEKRAKQQKTLLVRKRKALSDLFKELKRAGFTANVKPDVLRQQQDPLWIKEQPVVVTAAEDAISITRGENYFNRLLGSLPTLRASLANHHSDLTTRDLQRGVFLLESAFSVALDSRSCLAETLDSYRKFQRVCRRLRTLLSSPKVFASGNQFAERLQLTTNSVCRLANALAEVVHGLKTFKGLESSSDVALSISEGVISVAASTNLLRDRMITAMADVRLTEFSLLLESEHSLFLQALDHVSHVSASLCEWSESVPRLKYLFSPVQHWMDLEAFSMPAVSKPTSITATHNRADAIIDALLVNMQSILSRCTSTSGQDTPEERDNYIRADARLVHDFTRLLNLEVILDRLDNTLPHLAAYSPEALQRNLKRIFPFLERYMKFAEEQLVLQSQWVNALFKLDFVLCSVMSTLAKEGFCQPPDGEEGEPDGDATDAISGTGLGEGSGTENVSKEIEDESQVEGLQGQDEESNQPRENSGEDDAIEMGEDFEGEMEDVPEPASPDQNESDQDSDADPEEKAEKLDASDPSAVDEKLWGDEEGPDDSNDTDHKTNKDHSCETSGDSDVVAKEKESQAKQEKENATKESEDQQPAPEDQPTEEDMADEGSGEEDPNASGAPMDDHIQDANTLDLPDNIDLGLGEEMQEDPQTAEEEEDDMDVDGPQENDVPDGGDDKHDNAESPNQNDLNSPDPGEDNDLNTGEEDQPAGQEAEGEDDGQEDTVGESGIARPDISTGEGASAPDQPQNLDIGESASTGQKGSTQGVAGQENGAEEQADQGPSDPGQPSVDPMVGESQSVGSATKGSQQGHAPSQPDIQLSNNPLRSLGDALKEIHQRFDEILDSQEQGDQVREQPGDTAEASQLEYLRPDEADHDMQALGSAGEEQVAKLNELKIVEDDQQPAAPTAPMDVDAPMESEHHEGPSQISPPHADPTTHAMDSDIEGAITQVGVRADAAAAHLTELNDSSTPKVDAEMEDAETADIEAELRRWQADGLPGDGAEHIWRLYESLTHDLAYALCEQLRLILEPTLATRLKGDYRTGKRLNMKKIIPYIASDYTKDKIWLRRTRPSQREYQVLISLDDSRSMAESHSVHLAYETLALVSKALSRLEVGDIGIAKFGEAVEILHGFDQGPFTDQAGTKIMNAFRFNQKATNVLALLETSLKILESAREHRSMGSTSAADLWQLQIIISDGICQDHDRLRTVLRKAEEQRVMIVFIVIDSLHSASTDPATSDSSAVQNSILSMKQVAWKHVNGAMEMQLERYLDSFPFEYYVVLRNVEALPEVLSGTLKQFFERISEE